MGFNLMKAWKDDKAIKQWELRDVLDVKCYDNTLYVSVKADTEWGFAEEILPWSKECELRFN